MQSLTMKNPEEITFQLDTLLDEVEATQASVIELEDVFNPTNRAEHSDFVARATVYVMNLTVMVFALPVGLALLFMNILGGENLRTTAHVMALTGLFSALVAANPQMFSTLL